MNFWVWLMIFVMTRCCKRLGWQIAVGGKDDGNVSDIIVGPPENVDRIIDQLEPDP